MKRSLEDKKINVVKALSEPRITPAERTFWWFGSGIATVMFVIYAFNGWHW